jgi:hypothetical protein
VSVLSNTSLLAGLGPVEIVSLPSILRLPGVSVIAACRRGISVMRVFSCAV